MAQFHDIEMPLDIASGATCTKDRQIQTVQLKSWREERNLLSADPRRTYDLTLDSLDTGNVDTLIAFWEGRRGDLYSFRLRDYSDYKSCGLAGAPEFDDQLIGTGNGTKTVFQLTKTYDDDINPYTRTITKPVSGTVLIGVHGSQVLSGVTVNHATGTVTFGVAPTAGYAVTAGFLFDVPVRFDGPVVHGMMTADLGDVTQAKMIEDIGA